ncbi:MAG: hypothetical protein H8D56_12665 [Planctomycetes bacterium]|nr:hypothetical protein [Planctomycetota bacterium]MBL7143839.1 hypothetical protein [Phycisphaerae bacterium]
MRKKSFFLRFLIPGTLVILCLSLMLIASGCRKKIDEQADQFVINMKEISAFMAPSRNRMDFTGGIYAWPKDEPFKEVIQYPDLHTDKPLYGELPVYSDLLNVSKTLYWVIDESAGPGKGYDTFFVDLNNDLDLGNDKPLTVQKSPPKGAVLKKEYMKQQTCFSTFILEFDNDNNSNHSIEVMPRLWFDNGSPRLKLVPTTVRRGRFKLAGNKFDVYLGYDSVRDKLNDPLCSFFLVNKNDPETPATWEWAGSLIATHRIGSSWYQFSATVHGDKVTAIKYEGDFGTLELGAGSRDFKNLGIKGSAFSSDRHGLAIGSDITEAGAMKLARSCRLPTGDYTLSSTTIQYGPLSIGISKNYHSDGQRMAKIRPKLAFEKWVYGIKIRKDRPFVLDFSNEPEVLFIEPTRTQRFKDGEEVKVMAVLIDPVLDIMIRHLSKMMDTYYSDGKKRRNQKLTSLDPKVIITRADGEKVAEGVMPFG